MDAIVKMLEKHQPFFEKISRNIYLQAIKDGFLGCMPIVLTSSIFLLIATLPGVVGITLPQPLIDWCNKLYNFTMGVMGIMVAGTTAKNFTASMNRRMPAGKVLNDGSTMVAAQCSMLLLAVTQFTTKFNGSELSVFDCTSMGTRGLFSAYIAAFITVWVYKFCVSRDLTIKLPKEVPGAIAQNFRDIIPFGGAVIICGIIDVVVRNLMGVPFSELLIKLLSPLFTAAETYPGLILIQAATAFFWFIGVHGPSIVQPGIDPIRLANQAENLQVLLAGSVRHIVNIKMPGLALNIRMEQHLHEHVAQLFLQVRRITGVDGLADLIRLLQEVAADALVRLHLIPRAAIRRAQERDERHKVAQVIAFFAEKI